MQSKEGVETSKKKFEQEARRYIRKLRGEADDSDIHVRTVDQNFKPI
jgi:hypothetical protein